MKIQQFYQQKQRQFHQSFMNIIVSMMNLFTFILEKLMQFMSQKIILNETNNFFFQNFDFFLL